jgi:RNA polymerase sigma factor (sigma-70 family)
MSTAQINNVLDSLRRSAALQRVAALTDAELMRSYVAHRDEGAFETLVLRHGPMVLGVCRRLLANRQDAEDVFQATFLVLVRKAGAVKPREMVGNWLYGVAHHAALKVRANNAKRQTREKQVQTLLEPATVADGFWHDLEPLLDQELSRLPDKYRLPIVLCDLEGRTRSEAARQLGWPEGTVAGRLARGRSQLAKRLTRLGLPLSVGVFAAVLSQNATAAAVPAALVHATILAANGVMPASVAAVTKGVLNAMLYTKLKIVVAVVLALGVMGGGAVWLSHAGGMQAGEPSVQSGPMPKTDAVATAAKASEDKPKSPEPEKPKEKADNVSWGKAVNGLQAGIGYKVGAKRAYRLGEAVPLVVLLHNVSDQPIKFKDYDGFFTENAPNVTDADGKPATLSPFPKLAGFVRLLRRTLEADETIELGSLELNLEAMGSKAAGKPILYAAPGRYRISYTGLIPNDRGDASKSPATGQLDLNIKEAEQPKEKADDVSWGKAMDGLQAGIASKGTYQVGEKAAFVVKVRNVSDKKVTLTYFSMPFDGVHPRVEDADGKALRVTAMPPLAFYFPTILQRNLEPGEVFEVGKPQLQFATAIDKDRVTVPTIVVELGKYQVSFPGFSAWAGSGSDTGTNRLSTGKAAVEVKAADKVAAKADDTVWGVAKDGLQAGISVGAVDKQPQHVGDTLTFVVKVRNVGDKKVTLSYHSEPFKDAAPAVEDAAGKAVKVMMPLAVFFRRVLVHRTLEPGEVITIDDAPASQLTLAAAEVNGVPRVPTVVAEAGSYRVSYPEFAWVGDADTEASRLSTGKVAVTVTK